MVFALNTVFLKLSRLFGPASRPIQPSGMPSESVAVPVYKMSFIESEQRKGKEVNTPLRLCQTCRR